jgi:hypothetical protein
MVRAGLWELGAESGERAKVASLVIADRRAVAPPLCMRGMNATSLEILGEGERC